jgi:hypothetical protein
MKDGVDWSLRKKKRTTVQGVNRLPFDESSEESSTEFSLELHSGSQTISKNGLAACYHYYG